MTDRKNETFIEEIRRLKREAAEQTPTVGELAKRLREIEKAHKGRVVSLPNKPETDAA